MSAIASISSSNINTATQDIAAAPATQPKPEASEVKGASDSNGNSDSGGTRAVQAPAPTVNMNGQKIGQLIVVSA
jgi:hypothetical protein